MFRATLLLADSAQVSDGKLFVLGGGWALTGPQPAPTAIAAMIEVPSSEANRKISFEFVLAEYNGKPVEMPGGAEIRIAGDLEVGSAIPGVPDDWPLFAPIAVNLPGLPLVPGRSYEWRLTIDGAEDESVRRRFFVRPA